MTTAGRLAKRTLDLITTICLLVLTLPLGILTALAVKLDSPGPVFFKQERIGKDQKPFVCYKFRSMAADNDPAVHQKYLRELLTGAPSALQPGGVYKLSRDQRITRVGFWIRKLSIDELPQLWNVFKGEMSLVGPRPAIPYELTYYQPEMLRRFTVQPGLTGKWQTSGRSALSYQKMVELDLAYIDRWSLKQDIIILLKTILQVGNLSKAF
jgi:lipopolysaccharide/colanic/teichoic acid biosynthesis glycosyltransferase